MLGIIFRIPMNVRRPLLSLLALLGVASLVHTNAGAQTDKATAAITEMIAALAMGNRCPIDPAPFAPTRVMAAA